MSKALRIDQNTRQIWWYGQLAKTTWELPSAEDRRTMYGLDIEADIHYNIAIGLTNEFNISKDTYKWLRFAIILELITNKGK